MNGTISFILGSSCHIKDFRKASCCQLLYHYQYRHCSRPYHWHLGGGGGYSGGRCSWGWGGRCGLGNYPQLTSSLGQHGPSLVTHLGSCGFSSHGRSADAWLWLGWSKLGLLQLGLGLGPWFGAKPTL